MNGNGERITTPNTGKQPTAPPRNYKLLVDPMITGKKEPKFYRYDGIVLGDVTSSVVVRDPRSRLATLKQRVELDLPVPR